MKALGQVPPGRHYPIITGKLSALLEQLATDSAEGTGETR